MSKKNKGDKGSKETLDQQITVQKAILQVTVTMMETSKAPAVVLLRVTIWPPTRRNTIIAE
jgi:hypothetical protein